MTSKNVHIDLSDAGWYADAVSAIDSYRQEIESKCKQVLERMKDEAVRTAESGYASALYTGVNDASVYIIDLDEFSFEVDAEGTSVLFIEFGTGILNPDDPIARADLQVNTGIVSHGEWGKGHGADPEGWTYRGARGTAPNTYHLGGNAFHTIGHPANSVIHHTKIKLDEEYEKIAKEVFG